MPLYTNPVPASTMQQLWGNVSGRWANRQYTSAATLMTANTLRLLTHPVFTAITLDSLAIDITTVGAANSVVRLGVFRCDVTTGVPTTLVSDLGTVSGTAGTGPTAVTGIGLALSPGLYAWGASSQGAPATHPTIRVFSNGGAPIIPNTGTASSDLIGRLNFGWNLGSVSGAFAGTIAPTAGDTIPAFLWKWA